MKLLKTGLTTAVIFAPFFMGVQLMQTAFMFPPSRALRTKTIKPAVAAVKPPMSISIVALFWAVQLVTG